MEQPQQSEEKAKEEEEDGLLRPPPLHGDVLLAVLSHVSTVDLLAASRVSREWRRAVCSALRFSSRLTPWLIVHLHTRLRGRYTTYAFDPHSRTWLTIPSHVPTTRPLRPTVSAGLLYALSLSRLAVSVDSFGAIWREIEAPRVWREDPVVAMVGPRVAVLGGACDLALEEGEEPGAVEVHLAGHGWETCEAMPPAFTGSASATWLTAAVSERRVHVVERKTGWASWFDPETRRWGPARQLRVDGAMSDLAIGSGGGDRLILVGVGDADDEEGNRNRKVVVRMWEVEGERLEVVQGEETEMPREMAERLFPEEDEEENMWGWRSRSVELCSSGNYGYIYNRAEPSKGMVLLDYINKTWEWVPTHPGLRDDTTARMLIWCSAVGLEDLAAIGIGPR